MLSFVAAGRTDVRRSSWRPFFGFIQFALATFMLTVPIHALYSESLHGKEERTSSIVKEGITTAIQIALEKEETYKDGRGGYDTQM